MKKIIRIATRKSPLAMWQAEFVRDELLKIHTDLSIEIIGMTTKGDEWLETPLSKIGGKGLFVKELENAILNDKADIAVHSMKDVGVHFPDGLTVDCIMARHNPFDAFVSNEFMCLDDMPEGSVIGTCSLRRIAQLQFQYPHLVFKPLRGNVNTRLQKLDDGIYNAIILAVAGLERLQLNHRIAQIIPADICLPAIAQGSLGIERRSSDEETKKLLAPLIDKENMILSTAERAVNERLNGSCQTPIAAYATIHGSQLNLHALIGQPDGSRLLKTEKSGHIKEAHAIGIAAADDLLSKGAAEILKTAITH